jgi:hypothetical protein
VKASPSGNSDNPAVRPAASLTHTCTPSPGRNVVPAWIVAIAPEANSMIAAAVSSTSMILPCTSVSQRPDTRRAGPMNHCRRSM